MPEQGIEQMALNYLELAALAVVLLMAAGTVAVAGLAAYHAVMNARDRMRFRRQVRRMEREVEEITREAVRR